MTKSQFTATIRLKGWQVKDALEYWGRSYDWYTDNCNGDAKAQLRLECLINGLNYKSDGEAYAPIAIRHLGTDEITKTMKGEIPCETCAISNAFGYHCDSCNGTGWVTVDIDVTNGED